MARHFIGTSVNHTIAYENLRYISTSKHIAKILKTKAKGQNWLLSFAWAYIENIVAIVSAEKINWYLRGFLGRQLLYVI
jgi:hypothetical protein